MAGAGKSTLSFKRYLGEDEGGLSCRDTAGAHGLQAGLSQQQNRVDTVPSGP